MDAFSTMTGEIVKQFSQALNFWSDMWHVNILSSSHDEDEKRWDILVGIRYQWGDQPKFEIPAIYFEETKEVKFILAEDMEVVVTAELIYYYLFIEEIHKKMRK